MIANDAYYINDLYHFEFLINKKKNEREIYDHRLVCCPRRDQSKVGPPFPAG